MLKPNAVRTVLDLLAGLFFVAGILLAGSDSPAPFFPWVNILGVFLFALMLPVVWLRNRMDERNG